MAKCSQCDKPAIGRMNLCVDCYFKLQQAIYLQWSMAASLYNLTNRLISNHTGGLMPPRPIAIPPPPSSGDTLTFNNINVDRSTIGTINTGFISNLDTSITLMQSSGEDKLADAVKELTQAIYDSKEVNDDLKNEIYEQLQFLIAQATAEPENRSIGVAKGILTGIRGAISVAAGLLAIWDKVELLLKTALGIS